MRGGNSIDNSSANITYRKINYIKKGKSEGFLGKLLGSLLKRGLALMKNVLKPLAKSVLISLGLTAAASAIDAAILKKMFGSG